MGSSETEIEQMVTGLDTALYFVCGTPSNRSGFEFAILGGAVPPGDPGSYLDRAKAEDSWGSTYNIETLEIEGTVYTVYLECRSINPNDGEVNRGAYIAVGFLVAGALSVDRACGYLRRIAEIFGHLGSFIREDRRFEKDFHLKDYEYSSTFGVLKSGVREEGAPLTGLADLVCQASCGVQYFAAERGHRTFKGSDGDIRDCTEELRFYTGGDKETVIRSLQADRERYEQIASDAMVVAEEIKAIVGELELGDEALQRQTQSHARVHASLGRLAQDVLDQRLGVDGQGRTNAHPGRSGDTLDEGRSFGGRSPRIGKAKEDQASVGSNIGRSSGGSGKREGGSRRRIIFLSLCGGIIVLSVLLSLWFAGFWESGLVHDLRETPQMGTGPPASEAQRIERAPRSKDKPKSSGVIEERYQLEGSKN